MLTEKIAELTLPGFISRHFIEGIACTRSASTFSELPGFISRHFIEGHLHQATKDASLAIAGILFPALH